LTKLIICDYVKSTAFICGFVELIKQKFNMFVYGTPAFILHKCCARESVSNDNEHHFIHVCAYYINNIKYEIYKLMEKNKPNENTCNYHF